jgi:diguanylate cyclase
MLLLGLKMKPPLHQRLADDLQLFLIVIVAGLAFFFITPLTIYRLISGHYIVAVSNAILVVLSLGFALKALRTGQTRTPGLAISTICWIGVVVVTLTRGDEGYLWFSPLIIFVFHLTPPWFAMALVFGGLGVVVLSELLWALNIFPSTVHLFIFVATSVCVILFSHAFAKRNMRQRKKLQNLAATDGLTNLKNRRCLDSELARAAAAKVDLGMDFGLIILDLDNLKDINDNLGHSRGDRVLMDLAHLISNAIRRGDQAFRYGGDEFVVLLSNVSAQGLEEVCKNLRQKIKASIHCNGMPVTVSMGAAVFDEADTAQQWFQKADECLYQAKKGGRNRYHLHC